MSPVVGAKLGEDVANMGPHCGFTDGKLVRDLFIAIPPGNQPQYIDFTSG